MRTTQLSIALLIGLLITFSDSCFGYEKVTHQWITSRAYEASNLNKIVSSGDLGQIGLDSDAAVWISGVTHNSQRHLFKIGGWIAQGGYDEDIPSTRAVNHFFDPITGLGLIYNTFILCSSRQWGLGIGSCNFIKNEYSYKKTYEYYLKGLTEANLMDRESNLAQTFYSIGHVLHLIQDLAQPQHVRNDQHLDIKVIGNPSLYEDFTKQVTGYMPFAGYPVVYPAYSQVIDTPNRFWKSGWINDRSKPFMGMAEFTNYNFVSEGTNFDEDSYAYPALSLSGDTPLIDIQTLCNNESYWPTPCPPGLSGKMQFKTYPIQDPISGQVVNNRESTYSIFSSDLSEKNNQEVYSLNRFNFKAAHNFLIPRAVAYSAGMINYFFRGSMDVSLDDSGNLEITNTSGLPMQGVFKVYYDGANGTRHEVPSATYPSSGIVSLNAGAKTSQTLAPPTSPAPGDPGKYLLVFTGKIGAEEGIAAKIFKLKPTDELQRISAGVDHTCGIRTNGTVACWGDNSYGQATQPGDSFKQVSFKQVSANFYHTCGVRTVGTVACWGVNPWGQASPPGGSFKQVSAWVAHTCGVRTDGTVACWGNNSYGPPSGGSFKQVSTGYAHTCGIRTDGTVTCWGNNYYGTPSGGSFKQVSTGAGHTCGIRTDGTVACWGDNSYGQATQPGGSFKQVSAGWSHTCGIRTDGTVACWGYNYFGQASPSGGSFRQVSAGNSHTCGIRTNGTVACWGDNYFGKASPPGGSFLPP